MQLGSTSVRQKANGERFLKTHICLSKLSPRVTRYSGRLTYFVFPMNMSWLRQSATPIQPLTAIIPPSDDSRI